MKGNLRSFSIRRMLSTVVILALLGSAFACNMESESEITNGFNFPSDEKCPSMVDCPLNCEMGYAVNADGCRVCECSNKPCRGFSCVFTAKFTSLEKPCKETCTCNILRKNKMCPEVICQTFCEYGFELGSSGCPVCKCKPHPCKKPENLCDSNHTCIASEGKCDNPPCDWTSKCAPKCEDSEEENDVICEFGDKRDENDCKTGECKKGYCDGVTCSANQECVHDPSRRDSSACVCKKTICDLSCPFGLARDNTGCQTCKCAANPCERVMCNYGFKCLPTQVKACLERPCPYKAKCIWHEFVKEDYITLILGWK